MKLCHLKNRRVSVSKIFIKGNDSRSQKKLAPRILALIRLSNLLAAHNHSRAFFNLLTSVMADWERRKEKLDITAECRLV